ncbi:MAG: class I SAM-dependent methyltransferase [Sulfuricaulis sp.]
MISQESRHWAAVFDRIAGNYDNVAQRFSPFCADRLISRLGPLRGAKILDIATGTGVVALAAAQAVGAAGRVTAIDLAEAMLDCLQKKIDKFGLGKIDLHVMDAATLEFRRDYFDIVICSYGLFFLPVVVTGLEEWVRVTKPGGRIVFTVFGKRAFLPMLDLFIQSLRRYGVVTADNAMPVAAMRVAEPMQCRELLAVAGLQKIEVVTEQFGYHLKDENQWWGVVWNSGLHEWVEMMPPPVHDSFKTEHLAEVRSKAGENGLWFDVETHIAFGTKS